MRNEEKVFKKGRGFLNAQPVPFCEGWKREIYGWNYELYLSRIGNQADWPTEKGGSGR